jgi:hypothetical protein
MGRQLATVKRARVRGRGEKKEAGGSDGGRRVEAGNGKERGGPGTMEVGSGGLHRPPAGGLGRRRCRAIVEGSGTQATRARAADG